MEERNKKMENVTNQERKGQLNNGKHFYKKKSNFRHRQELNQNNRKEGIEKVNSVILDIKQASKTAKEKLADALDKRANAVVSISREGENWTAVIEVIDEEYLPGKNLDSMSDIIGVYDVKLSSKGELLNWNKRSSRKRGNVSA
jgi:hypothetical protein